MKNSMKSNAFWCLSALVAMLFACGSSLHAQQVWTQEDACPGWNNPQNFATAGDGVNFFYQGRLGKKIKNGSTGIAPNMTTGETGYANEATYAGSASAAQGTWDLIPMTPASQMGTITITGQSDHAAFPTGFDQNKPFAIYSYNTPNASTGAIGMDANTGNGLPYVPTSFNTTDSTLDTPDGNFNTTMEKSIRIGDAFGGTNATGLYYNMFVNSQNAMFFIYYACVIPRPTTYVHGISCDPAFIIRVCKQNSQGKWVSVSPYRDSSDPLQAPNSAPYCDSLAYAVSSTPAGDASHPGGTVVIGQDGWHEWQGSPGGNGTSNVRVLWKEWSKVSLNLSNFYGEHIRIEVMVSDCCQTQHYAYAYVAGECRPMSLANSGCPAGRDTNVTVLSAPKGLQSYVWYASEFGKGQCTNPSWLEPGGNFDYYTWRRLTTGDSTAADAFQYHVRSTDFRVRKRGPRNAVVTLPRDSTGTYQYFRCKIISALNPARPIISNLYTGVSNVKPTMDVKRLSLCGGDVKLRNTSFVPGGSESDVDLANTKWSFYDNANCIGTPIDTTIGDSITVHFDNGDTRYVLVRSTNTPDPNNPSAAECYSEAIYPITPLMNPKAGMTISNRVLCDDGEATIYDTSSNVTYRRWLFRPDNAPEDDDSSMAVYSSHEQSITRSFTHAVEPIELYIRNGLYSISDTNQYDTTWCSDIARDTVRVFTHPELEVTGDTIVCKGSTTNATVAAVGVDGCSYQWSKTLGTVTGNLPAGPTLRVEPSSSVETYYVRVTSPQNCVAWDSIRVYLVQPTLTMIPANGIICPSDTVTLIGGNAAYYTWSASPVDSTLIDDTADMILVTPEVNTVYTMVGHGTNDCDADPLTKSVTVKPLPVPQVSYEPTIVDVDDPTVILRNLSEYSVGADWEFADGETASGNEVTHTFAEATGSDTVYVTLSPYNELNCPVHFRFGIPVALYNAWFPNVFTPNSEDENAHFRMYANMPYEVFHLYIYNRRGEVVYETNSPEFSWDGTCNGVNCPQGAYVYVCRYRKPGMLTLVEQRGTVTLVR